MKSTVAVDWHNSSLGPFLFIEVDYSTCLNFFQTVLLCNPDWPLTCMETRLVSIAKVCLPCLYYVAGEGVDDREQDLGWGHGVIKGFELQLHGKGSFIFFYKSLKLIILPRIQEILPRTSQTASILLAWVGRVCVWVRVLLGNSVWHEIVYTRPHIEFRLPLPLECQISVTHSSFLFFWGCFSSFSSLPSRNPTLLVAVCFQV